MAQRQLVERRSPTEWGVRGALAAALVLLGFLGVSRTLAQVVQERDPARAHQLAADDGRATAALAMRDFVETAQSAARSDAGSLARLALRQDPTAVQAVVTLGLQAQSHGDTRRARALFAYAQRLSRRDFQTQFWAIEDSVGRGDIAEALKHYDIALRTSKSAPNLLFPVLGSAIAEPEVRRNLAITLARKPAWAPGFFSYLAATTPDPRAMATFFADLRRAGRVVPPEAATATINSLFAGGDVTHAWEFYSLIRRHPARTRSRDPRFTADLEAPSIFDWAPVNNASVSTSIQSAPRGGLVDFSAPASIGGPLAQQVQVLPAGAYRLSGHSIGVEQPDRSLPYWVLTCQDGRELGRVVVPNSTKAQGTFEGRFRVPDDCPVQTLALTARPSDQVSGLSGQIDRLELVPSR